MRTESACAGAGSTIIWVTAAAEQTAATVSAASRAEDLLGNGIPPGTYRSAGTRVGRGTGRRDRWAARRAEQSVNSCPPNFYARQSPARPGWLSRFRPCTQGVRQMNRSAWVEIRLG
nr:hypothetical protein StreXyl84_49150 [Streptomyces sp. Xyl84]